MRDSSRIAGIPAVLSIVMLTIAQILAGGKFCDFNPLPGVHRFISSSLLQRSVGGHTLMRLLWPG
jgi:hypothetical protein